MKKQNPEIDIFKYKRIRDIRVGIDYPSSRCIGCNIAGGGEHSPALQS